MDALTARSAATQAGHVGFRPRFIKEDELRRVEAGLFPPPRPAGLPDVRPVLFAGTERLFLYVSSNPANT
jgi:hypothetical protein